MAQIGRFWRTVRHLKLRQLLGRVNFRLARPKLDTSEPPALRSVKNDWISPARRGQSMTGPGGFQFLGEEGSLDEHGWDGPQLSKLWRYNQHYFDDLNAIGAETRHAWHSALIDRWIAENPPTYGSGWEPYPTSMRIVNWIKFALGGHGLSDVALHSLTLQIRWLTKRIEWHLLGNHLFVNAKALVFAGLFFDDEEADGWFATGVEILREQLTEQILADGAQFELSPMYHALALEDVLDLVNVARAQGEEALSLELSSQVPAMLDWLLAMTHPDGKIALFNDAAFGIAPDNGELCDYLERLGFSAKSPSERLKHYRESGYVRMEHGGAVLIADVAIVGPDYLPGHAHADTLSFELSLHGRRLIVNGGTSVYGKGPERLRQRGTAAHSTLVIDGKNSSEVWSGFRVGRRARPFNIAAWEEDGNLALKGEHDGYSYLPGRPRHRREWRLSGERLSVEDVVEGFGTHRLEAIFHLGPKISAVVESNGNSCQITTDDDDTWEVEFFAEGGSIELSEVSWHPEFGASVPGQAIRVSVECSLPHRLRSEFRWRDH